MMNLNYLMDHILYQIFKNILSKKQGEKINENDNTSIKYVNKTENRITLKIITRYLSRNFNS